MKFTFSTIETSQGIITVEASDYDQALKLAYRKYQDDDVLWADREMTVSLDRSED